MRSRRTRGAAGYGGLVRYWLLVMLAMACLTVGSGALAGRLNGGPTGGVVAPLAAVPDPMPAQFDLTGYLERAAVDPAMCPNLDPRLWGGSATINGQDVIIPCNTILQMPAFSTTWSDLFALAPADLLATPNTGTPSSTWQSGLALGDTLKAGALGLLDTPWTAPAGRPTSYSARLPAHEFHVVGNVVGGQYIAGLVFISQQSLNAGQGVISCIDYATGELQVGGAMQPHGAPCPAPDGTFTRVRMNDPVGRFGIIHGGPNSAPGTVDVVEPGYDSRFTADTENPTMHSSVGYPICIPAFNPFATTVDPITGSPLPAAIDAKCPIYNRPVAPNCKSFDPSTLIPAFGPQPDGQYCRTWVMDMPGAHATNFSATDPMLAAPLVIGDIIGFHGTMKADANGPYISAHTIEANLGIYTQPHVPPSYVFMEGVLVGTGGGSVGGVPIESTTRVSWVGFSTDPTELVDFYSLHQDPVTGKVTSWLQGTYDPCCKPLGRFRSPVNNLGAFGDPQRNYRAVSRTMCQTTPPSAQLQTRCMIDPSETPDPTGIVATPLVTQNGLVAGQYLLPNFEFIFAENLGFGDPLIPANLQDLPFLFCGSGPLDGPANPTSPIVGQLYPPPWGLPMGDPAFHSTLCPSALAVGAVVVPDAPPPPPAPLPAVMNSVTASAVSAPLGQTTVVTLAANATNPNTPALAMSYAWTFTAPAGVTVSMSCGVCAADANSQTVTATIVVAANAAGGPIVFTATVSNGVLPAATGSANVLVPSGKAPTITKVTAPGKANGATFVTISAVGATNPTGGNVKFTFKQVSGPLVYVNQKPVPLGQELPSTFSGSAATNDQTGTARFVAPISLVKPPNMVFQVTETDLTNGLTTTQSVTIQLAQFTTDTVAITSAAYVHLANRGGVLAELGALTVTATTNADQAPPTGWKMNATITARLSNGTLSTPVSVAMALNPPDAPGAPAVVCGPVPCWVGSVIGVITDPTVTPSVLLAPDTIAVKSSLGGTSTVLKGSAIYTIR